MRAKQRTKETKKGPGSRDFQRGNFILLYWLRTAAPRSLPFLPRQNPFTKLETAVFKALTFLVYSQFGPDAIARLGGLKSGLSPAKTRVSNRSIGKFMQTSIANSLPALDRSFSTILFRRLAMCPELFPVVFDALPFLAPATGWRLPLHARCRYQEPFDWIPPFLRPAGRL